MDSLHESVVVTPFWCYLSLESRSLSPIRLSTSRNRLKLIRLSPNPLPSIPLVIALTLPIVPSITPSMLSRWRNLLCVRSALSTILIGQFYQLESLPPHFIGPLLSSVKSDHRVELVHFSVLWSSDDGDDDDDDDERSRGSRIPRRGWNLFFTSNDQHPWSRLKEIET